MVRQPRLCRSTSESLWLHCSSTPSVCEHECVNGCSVKQFGILWTLQIQDTVPYALKQNITELPPCFSSSPVFFSVNVTFLGLWTWSWWDLLPRSSSFVSSIQRIFSQKLSGLSVCIMTVSSLTLFLIWCPSLSSLQYLLLGCLWVVSEMYFVVVIFRTSTWPLFL